MIPYFSLIIASRNRTVYLRETIKNIALTAHSQDNYEIILIVDDDDPETLVVAQEIATPNIFIHTRPRGNNFVEHYLNWSFKFTRAKYIFLLGDDVWFKTKDWDIKAYNKLEIDSSDHPDNVILGVTDDGIANHLIQAKEWDIIAGSSFPIIGRRGIEILGFILDPHFYDKSADLDMILAYTKIGRTIDLRDCVTAIHMPIEWANKFGEPYHYEEDEHKKYKELSKVERKAKTDVNAVINAEILRKSLRTSAPVVPN